MKDLDLWLLTGLERLYQPYDSIPMYNLFHLERCVCVRNFDSKDV